MFERQLLSVVPWSLLALPVNPFRISSLSTMPRKRTYRKVKNKIFALVLFNASNKSLPFPPQCHLENAPPCLSEQALQEAQNPLLLR
jgi:hypothetical protein